MSTEPGQLQSPTPAFGRAIGCASRPRIPEFDRALQQERRPADVPGPGGPWLALARVAPRFQGIASPGRWACSVSGRRLTIGFAGRGTIFRPAYSGLWAVPTRGGHTPSDLLHGRSYHVGDLTRPRRRTLGPASSLFRSGCSPHSPTSRSGGLHLAPPERRFARSAQQRIQRTGTARSLRRAVVTWAPPPRLPCADATPALYSRTVATNIPILWYTASGTFIWSKAAGCTMAPPERRLAAPWGPKLS